MNDTKKDSIGESIVGIFFVVILVGGLWAWGNDSSTKKKQDELDTANARIVALEKQQQDKQQAEEQRASDLATCLWTADYNKEEFLKLNGTFNKKTGVIRAPITAFQLADAKRSADISQCQIQYGAHQ